MKDEKKKKRMKVHFIGIGGIGLSALAQYYFETGWRVSGSDLVSSEITEALKNRGIKVFFGEHKANNVPKSVDAVIYTAAVPKTNVELKKAYKLQSKNKQLKIMSYAEALGELTKKYFTIAVSGTHGKSTTTAMIAFILMQAGLDPSLIIGTKLREFENAAIGKVGNFIFGKSKYLVVEADEWNASFLNYWPKVIVLTNIEQEHLDYYKNLKNILKTYQEYISHLPTNGVLVVNFDNENVVKITEGEEAFSYSLKQEEAKKLKNILQIPGDHNISNALAALTVARFLGIPDEISFRALSEYKGSWRRFEEKRVNFKDKFLRVVSDYAHHPTEVKVTLNAAREKFPDKKIWVVFQPHQHQRTNYLFDDFVQVFKEAPIDRLIIINIYDVAGRERDEISKKVSSKKLINAIKKPWALYIPYLDGALKFLKNNLQGNEVLVIMGAGSIYKLYNQF